MTQQELQAIGQVVRAYAPQNAVRQFLPPEFWGYQADFFTYLIDYNTLAANAVNQVGNFTVDTDSSFLCLTMGYAEGTTAVFAAEQGVPQVTVQISDTSSPWQNVPAYLTTMFGDTLGNDGPRLLPFGRFIPGGQTVTCLATDLGGVLRRLVLAFGGVKISNRIRKS